MTIQEVETNVEFFKGLHKKGIKYSFLCDESDAMTGINGLNVIGEYLVHRPTLFTEGSEYVVNVTGTINDHFVSYPYLKAPSLKLPRDIRVDSEVTNVVDIPAATKEIDNLPHLIAAIKKELIEVRKTWAQLFQNRGGEIILCENAHTANRVYEAIRNSTPLEKQKQLFLVTDLSDTGFVEITRTLVKFRELSNFTVVTIMAAGRGIDFVSSCCTHVIICSQPSSVYELHQFLGRTQR